MGKQLTIEFNEKLSPKYWNVPFVDEVQEFNDTFGKPNNYEPTIGEKKEWQFVYDFIQEELDEYKELLIKANRKVRQRRKFKKYILDKINEKGD